jgi:hypothetical protein
VIWRVYAPDTGNVTISASHIIDFVHEQSNRPTGDFTYGDPGFISAALADGTYAGDGNFDLLSGSVLRHRVTTLLSPVDVDNHLRTSPGSIGAYAGA